jgi:predicted  nucleic acid-binding Zn-ribbon protein
MTDAEFENLKKEHDRANEEVAEAKGAIKSLKERLEEEFGLKTVEEARLRLKKLGKECERLEAEFKGELAKYRKEFAQ